MLGRLSVKSSFCLSNRLYAEYFNLNSATHRLTLLTTLVIETVYIEIIGRVARPANSRGGADQSDSLDSRILLCVVCTVVYSWPAHHPAY